MDFLKKSAGLESKLSNLKINLDSALEKIISGIGVKWNIVLFECFSSNYCCFINCNWTSIHSRVFVWFCKIGGVGYHIFGPISKYFKNYRTCNISSVMWKCNRNTQNTLRSLMIIRVYGLLATQMKRGFIFAVELP